MCHICNPSETCKLEHLLRATWDLLDKSRVSLVTFFICMIALITVRRILLARSVRWPSLVSGVEFAGRSVDWEIVRVWWTVNHRDPLTDWHRDWVCIELAAHSTAAGLGARAVCSILGHSAVQLDFRLLVAATVPIC